MEKDLFHQRLKFLMDEYAHSVYKATVNFSREEVYGITSQLRRAVLSVILNYIEGFARRKGANCKVYQNFLEISFGSLKESKYLVYFSFTENYFKKADYDKLISINNEIGKMLWSLL